MPRPGRNGTPQPRIQSRRTTGKLDPNLQSFANIGGNHFQLYLFDEGHQVESTEGLIPLSDERGPSVRFVVVKKLGIDLTELTHEEHRALRDFINRALDISEPIVLARDKEAQDAYDSGDDAFARLHRAVPAVTVRPRAERAHGEVLRLGLEAAAFRGWAFLNRLVADVHGGRGGGGDVGPGGDGGAVADGEQAQPVSEDGGPQAH